MESTEANGKTVSPAMVKPGYADPTGRLDGAARTVRSRAREFSLLAPAQRATLLHSLAARTAEVAEEWVRVSCAQKHISFDKPVSGEEWLGGPGVVVRNCRLLAESWERIAAGLSVHDGLNMTRHASLLETEVFPTGGFDKALFAGFTCTVTSKNSGPISGPEIPEGGKCCLVLGAGNVSSIPAMDVLYKMFVEGRTCILKMNPVNEVVGPIIEKAFAPLIQAGYLRVVYGGGDVGKFLCEHECVDEIHITGSDKTHDLIVWGPEGAERDRRKAANDPLNKRAITSELGNVSPVIIVPGEYTAKELAFMAKNVAAMVANNASFNCNAAKMLVTAACWKQRGAFLRLLADTLAKTPARIPYYPGAWDRWEDLCKTHPSPIYCGSGGAVDNLPWTLLRDLNPLDSHHPLFSTEPFCGILSEVTIPGSSPWTFLREAVRFCNESLWGTLNASVMINPRMQKSAEGQPLLENAIADLNYGTVAVNHWPALGYGFVSPPWGAAPGHTLADVKSGIGWVHNTYMLRNVLKSVIRGPLVVSPKPAWFTDNAKADVIGRKLVAFEANPSAFKLPGIVASALRG